MSIVASKFEPRGDNFAYFPNFWSGGYEITSDEKRTIERNWVVECFAPVVIAGVAIFVLALPILVTVKLLELNTVSVASLELAIAVLVGVILIWSAVRPSKVVRGREVTFPRRSLLSTDQAEGSNLSWWMLAIMWLCVPVWSVVYLGLALSYPLAGVPLSIVLLLMLFRLTRWTYFKWKTPTI